MGGGEINILFLYTFNAKCVLAIRPYCNLNLPPIFPTAKYHNKINRKQTEYDWPFLLIFKNVQSVKLFHHKYFKDFVYFIDPLHTRLEHTNVTDKTKTCSLSQDSSQIGRNNIQEN